MARPCEGKADTLIVKKRPIRLCKTSEHCPRRQYEQLDLLVLLCYHADKHSKDLLFPPKHKANCTKCRVWDEKKTKDGLGSHVCLVILFIHAILVVTQLIVTMTWDIHSH